MIDIPAQYPSCGIFIGKEVRLQTEEEVMETLSEAIKLARRGETDKITCPEHCKPKLQLLGQGCILMFTLTRNRPCRQQFRAWVKAPYMLERDPHAGSCTDGYDHGAIFEFSGTYEGLKAVAEKYFVQPGRAYFIENDTYAIWF